MAPKNDNLSYIQPQHDPEYEEKSLQEKLLYELLNKSTELQDAKKRLTAHQKELDIARQIISSCAEGILFIDLNRRITYADQNFCRLTGFDARQLENQKLENFVSVPRKNQDLAGFFQQALKWKKWHGKVLLKKNGKGHTEISMAVTCFSDPKQKNFRYSGYVCQFLPGITATDSEQARNQTNKLYSYDLLTGLLERTAFLQHFSTVIEKAITTDSQVSLLYIDLDNFKRVNRMLGTLAGDKLLYSVATLLKQCAEEANATQLARLGGDEFAITITGTRTPPVADKLAASIINCLQNPIKIQAREIYITPSIGIAHFPKDGQNFQELFHKADTAQEIAKNGGGNKTCRWSTSMNTVVSQNLYLENDLREAVANGHLFNHYQPQIDLKTGVIIGMEALARWVHPEKGFISPAVFIPIAENTGIIEKIGLDLVKLACMEGKKWLRMGLKFTMAVNISGRLLRRNDLFEDIMECLESTGFPPQALEVEFTESVLMENMENTIRLIDKLREQGVKLAIDDFGTGYSSLSYLQRFAVDKIKIDRSFVMNVTKNPNDAAITRAIIAIAKKLNFEVLAEGVETEEQLFFLQENKCDFCQGFLFNKPLSPKDMTCTLMRDSSVALKHKRIIDHFYSIRA